MVRFTPHPVFAILMPDFGHPGLLEFLSDFHFVLPNVCAPAAATKLEVNCATRV